jgi:hypothetical protein
VIDEVQSTPRGGWPRGGAVEQTASPPGQPSEDRGAERGVLLRFVPCSLTIRWLVTHESTRTWSSWVRGLDRAAPEDMGLGFTHTRMRRAEIGLFGPVSAGIVRG